VVLIGILMFFNIYLFYFCIAYLLFVLGECCFAIRKDVWALKVAKAFFVDVNLHKGKVR